MVEPQYVRNVIEAMERHANEICFRAYTDVTDGVERHCLLGWLALEGGIPLPPKRYNGHVLGMSGTKRFAREMEKRYGLPLCRLKQLQFANDEAQDDNALIEAVTRLLEKWSGHRGNCSLIAIC